MSDLSVVENLLSKPTEERSILLASLLRQWLADFLEIDDIEEIDSDQNFAELGTTSTEAVSFKILLESKLGLSLRTTLLFDYPSLYLLRDCLLEVLVNNNPSELKKSEIKTINELVDSQKKSEVFHSSLKDEVVIIAAQGIFPNVDNLNSYWDKIISNNVLTFDNNSNYQYGRIKEYDFHPDFFSLRKDDLNSFSRPVKIIISLLERLLKDHGLSHEDLYKVRTGVFMGAEPVNSNHLYQIPLSNIISYYLNLEGPSETINTFCTSSYVALHHAVNSIHSRECELAIVGGINCIDENEFLQSAANGWYDGLLSKNNITKSFCNSADGFVRSEGGGVLLLTSLEYAEKNNREILVKVKSTSVSHSGRSYSMEAPNVKGIRQVITDCFNRANISTDSIDYIEAHGIGNPLADAMELNTISSIYNQLSKKENKKWHISSVKPTIGHPERAAGIASLLKVIKSIQNRIIPGIPGLEKVTDELSVEHHLVFNHNPVKWNTDGNIPRKATLNSYAIGGVNAHVILEEYISNAFQTKQSPNNTFKKDEVKQPKNLLTLSSSTKEVLTELFYEIFNLDLHSIDLDLSPARYGLNSLKIVQLIRKINDRFQSNIRIGQVLGVESFSDFFQLIENNNINSKGINTSTSKFTTDFSSLSSTQKGLWYIQESSPDSTSFNVPLCFELKNVINQEILTQAINQILLDFPSLRVNFVQEQESESLVQYLRTQPEKIYISNLEVPDNQDKIDFLFSLLRIPFNLENELLLRTYIISDFKNNKSYLYFIIHHIVFDGLSGVIFSNRLWKYYDVLLKGGTISNNKIDFEFFHFVQWEDNYLKSNVSKEELDWWKNELEKIPPTIDLPYDTFPIKGQKNIGVGNEKLTIDDSLFNKIRQISSTYNVNTSIILLSAFNLFVNKITGEHDISLTTPVAGRPLEQYQESIGCYINLIVTRTYINPNQTFIDLLEQTKIKFIQAIDHSTYPFSELVHKLNLKTDPDQLVFPVSFTYQNFFDELNLDTHPLQYDIFQETDDSYTLEVYDRTENLELNFKYQKSLFKSSTIRRHLILFRLLLEQLLDNPTKQLFSYHLDVEKEFSSFHKNNNKKLQIQQSQCIHELIVEQANKTPDLPALLFEDKVVTYSELEQKSRLVALYLQSKDVKNDECVAILMERSHDAIIAILGVLRSGAAYLPLDTTSPKGRIEFVLRDAEIRFLLTDITTDHLDIHRSIETINIHNIPYELIHTNILIQDYSLNNLCYVLYTSGSTGNSKGVMIEHRSLVNLAFGMIASYGLTQEDRVLQFASLSFDMSVEEIFPYLLCGASIVVRKEDDIEALRFYHLVTDKKVTILNLPPLYFNVIESLSKEEKELLFKSVRLVSFGGEQLPQYILSSAQKYPIRIFNAYGPTECTVNVAISELTNSSSVNIGNAFYNTELYVVSYSNELLPIGCIGELYVAGLPLGRGYLNNANLTNEKFISNPFGEGIVYKTGDKVRWTDDFNLEYIGRVDDQVKIRGYRVELGEIEYYLGQYPSIKQVAVIADSLSHSIRIVAFYISDRPVDTNALSLFLSEKVPSYMIPAIFMSVEIIPTTNNGKVDRKKLLAILSASNINDDINYKSPESNLEIEISQVWKDILKLENISVTDNFFDLGGHSLLAIQITLRLSKIYRLNISINDLFRAGTIRNIAQFIEEKIHSTKRVDVDTLSAYEEEKNIILFS
jgi:amino acid adenylation domain-containing protein